MATFAANLTSCSAEKVNVSSWFGGGGGGGGGEFYVEQRHMIFGCPSHVAEMPAFCMQDTLCKMQHVVLYNLLILSALSLYLGTSYDDGSSHRWEKQQHCISSFKRRIWEGRREK